MARTQRAGDDDRHDIQPEQWARHESTEAAVEQPVQQVRAERPDQQQVSGIEARNPEHRTRKQVAIRDRQQQDEQHHPDSKVAQDENAAEQRRGQ